MRRGHWRWPWYLAVDYDDIGGVTQGREGGACQLGQRGICMPHLRTSSSSFIYFIAASFALWTQWPANIILIIALYNSKNNSSSGKQEQ